MTCLHKSALCLNEYELIRKYRCGTCSSVRSAIVGIYPCGKARSSPPSEGLTQGREDAIVGSDYGL